MPSQTVYIIDDERIVRISIADELREAGYNVFEFSNASSALSKLSSHAVDIIISDMRMPDIDGIELLEKVKKANPEIAVIMMTAYGTIDTAVKAIQLGAFDYITKPFDSQKIIHLVKRISEIKQIKKENLQLRSQLNKKFDFSSFVGQSKNITKIFDDIKAVADSRTPILITGETGTGKEMITNCIHYNSNRRKSPFIKVSCAALSKEIFESELFGHEKGAFTGAEKEKIGRFELADKGTLYFDDIDDVPLDLQVKLLRAIEQQEIEKVGGCDTIKIDVRIIASSKIDVLELVEKGRFREDLFYRLNVFPINIPPLRERRDDIPILIDHFVREFASERSLNVGIEVYTILQNQEWRGNVREIKNVIERLVLLASDNLIDCSNLPSELLLPTKAKFPESSGNKTLTDAVAEYEISLIRSALKKFNDNGNKAAESLGIPPSTLRSKISKYNL